MRHYLWLPLAGAPNRVCQFINPSCRGRMLFFSPPWMIGPDSQSEPVTVKRQSGVFFPPSARAQHIAHLRLPSLSTWLNIVTSLMNYGPLSLSQSHLLSLLLLSVSLPLLFRYAFYAVLLHSRLKASDFNKTIKKESRFYSVLCVSLVTWFSSCCTINDVDVFPRLSWPWSNLNSTNGQCWFSLRPGLVTWPHRTTL